MFGRKIQAFFKENEIHKQHLQPDMSIEHFNVFLTKYIIGHLDTKIIPYVDTNLTN